MYGFDNILPMHKIYSYNFTLVAGLLIIREK